MASWNDWLPPSTVREGFQSTSLRNTLFSATISAKSPPPTFLLLLFPLEENRHLTISFRNRLFYQAKRKYKLLFHFFFFSQQITVALTQIHHYITSNSSKNGDTVSARILQLQGSQSLSHFTSDRITIHVSKTKSDLFSD